MIPMMAGMLASGASVAPVGYRATILADSPRAFWMLDETTGAFADQTGTYPLTAGAGVARGQPSIIPSTTDASASQGGGAPIATNGLTVFPTGAEQALTIVAAVKVAALPASGNVAGIVHQGDWLVSGGQGVAIAVESNGAVRFQTRVGGTWYVPATAGGVIVAGTPLLLGVEHDPATDSVLVYKNGSLVATLAHTAGLGASTSDFNLGRGYQNDVPTSYCLNGAMQGCAVWASVRGAAAQLAYAQAAGFA